MVRVDLQEAQAQLDKLVEAALNAETGLIVQHEGQTVQLTPLAQPPRKRIFGSGAAGVLDISDDFDAPLIDDFVQRLW